MAYGSLSIADLLEINDTSIIKYGTQPVFAALESYVDDINQQVAEQLSMFARKTTERTAGIGGVDLMVAEYVDEGGISDTQKAALTPGTLGWPLRRSQVNRQWTNDWLRRRSPGEAARQLMAATAADVTKVQTALRTAIFRPTNYTFTDRLRDNQALFVKAFANADGFPIPPGQNATQFTAATHNHYVGTANALPSEADLDAVLANASEHGGNDQILMVNQTFGDVLVAGAGGVTYPNFVARRYGGQTVPDSVRVAEGGPLDYININNRVIGTYKGRKVWVKPWVPALVCWTFMTGPGIVPPIAWRIPDDLGGDNGNFRLVFDDYQHPNHVEMMEREFGFGAWNRVAAAVLSYNSGGTTYVQPSNL